MNRQLMLFSPKELEFPPLGTKVRTATGEVGLIESGVYFEPLPDSSPRRKFGDTVLGKPAYKDGNHISSGSSWTDDGKECKEPLVAVRYRPHSWSWFYLNGIEIIEERSK